MQLSTLIIPRAPSFAADNEMEKAVVGLEFVRGWYEILDDQGASRGQVLIGVYPLAENEENPRTARLCPRLEALLNPNSVARFQGTAIDALPACHSGSPNFDPIPTLTVSPPSSEIKPTPSSNSQVPPGRAELEQCQQPTSTSSLLTTLQ
ncbi:unnamed protein product [Hydatigera taeniaeformis]|uniref:Agenet domain-containing protein n=1 Tax=Hydatigena taeniaeformis TaxID=6205 RepID=A0A0R3WVD6_HYDTA|nr:unnamed protein product [Hydatigera taeniaeformis]